MSDTGSINTTDAAYYTFSPICGGGNDFDGRLRLHIAAIFVIFVTSAFGALFPLTAKKFPTLHIPEVAYTFAKFFGSGVIIATAFIHLLASSFSELGNPCLSTFWEVDYPWSAAFSMIAVFVLFLIELFAMRVAHMAFAITDVFGVEDKSVEDSGPRQHNGHLDADGELATDTSDPFGTNNGQRFVGKIMNDASLNPSTIAQGLAGKQRLDARFVGFFILEFGVIFHSVIIGLTLATTGVDFNTLFVVIIFHQTFEGLGLGSRLSILPFAKASIWPWILGGVYALVTPIGMAVGLGLRTTYDPASATALTVSGILDAISSGILLYTGLVELLAHEFLFSRSIREGPIWNLLFSVACLIAGTTIMALLGKWA